MRWGWRLFNNCLKSLILWPENIYCRPSFVIVEDMGATTPKIMRCFKRSMNILNESVHHVQFTSYFNAESVCWFWVCRMHRSRSRDYDLPRLWKYSLVSDLSMHLWHLTRLIKTLNFKSLSVIFVKICRQENLPTPPYKENGQFLSEV